jgi:hypothetical protein
VARQLFLPQSTKVGRTIGRGVHGGQPDALAAAVELDTSSRARSEPANACLHASTAMPRWTRGCSQAGPAPKAVVAERGGVFSGAGRPAVTSVVRWRAGRHPTGTIPLRMQGLAQVPVREMVQCNERCALRSLRCSFDRSITTARLSFVGRVLFW